MTNRTIAIVDINNFHNQNLETLLFASILENKVNKLSVLDLNYFNQDTLLPKTDIWQKKDDILTAKLFSNTSYQISYQFVLKQNKLINLAKTLQNKSDILLINVNSQTRDFNSPFYDLTSEIIVFVDIKHNLFEKIINLFINNSIKGKRIHLIVYNFYDNLQDQKKYLNFLKQFRTKNITISNIDAIPQLKTLKEIQNVDPWLPIYKKINSDF